MSCYEYIFLFLFLSSALIGRRSELPSAAAALPVAAARSESHERAAKRCASAAPDPSESAAQGPTVAAALALVQEAEAAAVRSAESADVEAAMARGCLW